MNTGAEACPQADPVALGSSGTKYWLVIWESANAPTGPHLRNSSRVSWERYGVELYLGARCSREGSPDMVEGSLLPARVE